MAIEKKLICFARLEEFERQLAAGNILDYSIVFIQDAKKIWNRGTYYDCSTLTESTISEWGFTKNTGTYSKPNGGIPKSDLASAVQTSLGKADTALQSYTEQYKGTVTGVKMNGASKGTSGVVDLGNVVTSVKINGLGKTPSNGVVDLGTVITEHQDISGKQDKLVSGTNIKTINGESVLGSGNISISGGESYWYEEEDYLLTDYPVVFAQAAAFTNGIEAPTSTPDGSISKGLAGQVLTTNGERCYWATPNSGGVSKNYVDEAIANAITTTLNTAV